MQVWERHFKFYIPGSIMEAPEFTLNDSFGISHNIRDYKNKLVVLYFYPKDNTPGCTMEAQDFSSKIKDFEKLNSVVIAISSDSCESHKKFLESKNLEIILLSDPDSSIQKKYGAFGIKKFMGKEYFGTIRSTFIIKNNKIIKKWMEVKVKGHAEEVLETLKTIDH